MRTPRPNPERDANLARDERRRVALDEFKAKNGEMPPQDEREARMAYQVSMHAFLVAKGLTDL